ncbi:endonuclease/exonuclease/phosphatase family protein [Chryseolinea sp. H1M3-3]|uniref:endonuclease/exonuclease/phosphatase family protein n=1 Tax=Chryseolinea sp. H1M3-3 TaxID=3034144 RepID=UPI0023EC6651|nr:endonuclease/exonuclease/phosphatase family protein [Chryseolinea sp. H1M3-3]
MRPLFAFIFFMATLGLQAQAIKVMTYNIRLDTPNDSINQWPKRDHKVYALIKKYDPDLIGLQEVLHHQLMDLLQNLPAYTYIGVGRDDGKTKGEYSAILYKKDRFKALNQNTFWLSETPEVPGSKSWDAAITRVASWGTFKDLKSNKDFLMINTHFDHIGKEARKNSAALLKQKASEIAKDFPLIITGDFNCTRADAPYATIMNPVGISLVDPAPKNPPGTFCSFKVNSITCNGIDYIFHSKAWNANAYQVIQDNDGKYYPSDHLPVMVNLTIQ